MTNPIADTIGIAREVLESHYPDADVRTRPGECDYRVGSVGASIFINGSGSEVSQAVVDDVQERVKREVKGRVVQCERLGADRCRFDLKS